jgi:hypothetical protein
MLGVDGEFYQIENCKRITYSIDTEVPKLRILKRTRQRKPEEGTKEMLTELKQSFKPSLF